MASRYNLLQINSWMTYNDSTLGWVHSKSMNGLIPSLRILLRSFLSLQKQTYLNLKTLHSITGELCSDLSLCLTLSIYRPYLYFIHISCLLYVIFKYMWFSKWGLYGDWGATRSLYVYHIYSSLYLFFRRNYKFLPLRGVIFEGLLNVFLSSSGHQKLFNENTERENHSLVDEIWCNKAFLKG